MRDWPPYATCAPLIHRHVGRPGIVVSGGPSVLSTLAGAPSNAVHVSVNDHGCRLVDSRPALGRRMDYVVGCDHIEPRLRPWGLPIIGRYMWADHRFLYMIEPSSAVMAAWVLRLMGCSPILIAGVDLYASAGGTYFDSNPAHQGKTTKPREHLKMWAKLRAQFPAMYRALGGHELLVRLLGPYDRNEPPAAAIERESLERSIGGVRVRVQRPCEIAHRPFDRGTVLTLGEKEAANVLKDGRGKKIKAGEA